jgi:hypothetical protein
MKFSELPDNVKDRLRDERRDWNVQDSDWWSSVYDDFLVIADLIGLVTHKGAISFSGFWSQGDGASFVGSWTPEEGMLEAVKAHAPEDKALHALVERLVTVVVRQRLRSNEKIAVEIGRTGGHYVHSGCMTVTTQLIDDSSPEYEVHTDPEEEDEHELKWTFRGLADWLYRQLEKEHEYLTSDEVVDQSFDGEEFDEAGEPI